MKQTHLKTKYEETFATLKEQNLINFLTFSIRKANFLNIDCNRKTKYQQI